MNVKASLTWMVEVGYVFYRDNPLESVFLTDQITFTHLTLLNPQNNLIKRRTVICILWSQKMFLWEAK